MNKTDRQKIEKFVALLEDPKRLRDSYKIPSGNTKQFSMGYVEGAKMQAKATAATLRELIGMEKDES